MKELITQLEEDLQFLSDNLTSSGPLPLANIRIAASGICRKWLIDRQLVRLFHGLNRRLTLPAIDTTPHVKIVDKNARFDFYTAGGVSIDGRPLNSIYAHKDPQPQNESRVLLPVPKTKFYSASKFLNRKCTFIEGNWITNEEIIRYVANKTGGVHYDERRDKFIETRIKRASEALWIGDKEPNPWPETLEVYLQVQKTTNAHWNCTHIEMLSIAQALLGIHVDGMPLVYSTTNPKSHKVTFLERFIGAFQRIMSTK